jgi:hypothetical protein
MAVVAVGLSVLGLPRWLAIGLPIAAGMAVLSQSRRSEKVVTEIPSQDDSNPGPAPEGLVMPAQMTSFTNVAFSENLPTWKGWKKNVGTLSINQTHVTATGPKSTTTLSNPCEAEIIKHKYLTWPIVKVTGTTGRELYVVPRGAPASVTAVSTDEMEAESRELVSAITGGDSS